MSSAAGRPTPASPRRLAVVGGGPAGLMAAEAASQMGASVDLYESKGSVGRKFLIAGRGGLNLTHSEPRPGFDARYGAQRAKVSAWLDHFDGEVLRDWSRGLGVDSFIGSSGRVFPTDMKAAPLLRALVRRLRGSGVRFHVHHTCTGWRDTPSRMLEMRTPDGVRQLPADAIVLALGGGSWPQLGSDGAWTQWLAGAGIQVAPLAPSNCGFDVGWSEHFVARFAGHPVKNAWLRVDDGGNQAASQGEFVITGTGVEGSLVYALSSRLRDAITRDGQARLLLDLSPSRSEATIAQALARPRAGRSLSELLRRSLGLAGVQAGLVQECIHRDGISEPGAIAGVSKSLPIDLLRPRPIAEAISSAGGVRFESVDASLMCDAWPGIFFAGEMLDWEAPTGGYLLTACLASGRLAGQAAATWLAGLGDM